MWQILFFSVPFYESESVKSEPAEGGGGGALLKRLVSAGYPPPLHPEHQAGAQTRTHHETQQQNYGFTALKNHEQWSTDKT